MGNPAKKCFQNLLVQIHVHDKKVETLFLHSVMLSRQHLRVALCRQQPAPCTCRALLNVDKMAAATKARAHQHLCTQQSFRQWFCFVAFLLLLLSLILFVLDIDWRLPWQYQTWGKRPNYPTGDFDSFCHWTKRLFNMLSHWANSAPRWWLNVLPIIRVFLTMHACIRTCAHKWVLTKR